MDKKLKKLLFKTVIFIFSLGLAWYLVKSGTLDILVHKILPLAFLAPFLAGCFYTSFLTTPLAIAMFLVLAPGMNPILLALIAGLGACLVDILLIKFLRDHVNSNLVTLTKHFKLFLIKKLLKVLKLDFLIPLLGAIVIASPLPDELGLFLLGESKLKYHQIIILTYIFNTAGILLITISINLLS